MDDVAVTEGDSGASNAAVTVRLSGASAREVRVNYRLVGFTATEGQDFTGGSGTLTFTPGETSKDVNVTVTCDALDELDESVVVELSAFVNARMSDPVAKLTITDNEQQTTISINDVSAAEGDSTFNSNQATFTVSLSAPSGLVVHVAHAAASRRHRRRGEARERLSQGGGERGVRPPVSAEAGGLTCGPGRG